MLITVPFPIQEHPAMLSPKPPQKYHPRGTRPRSNARTKNRKHKKSSSLQAADATNAGHQSRLIVADMAHSLEKGKRQNGEQRDPFETDLDAYCVPEAVRRCTEKVRVAVSWGDVFGLRRPERKFYLSFSFHDRHYWGPQRFSHEFLGSFRLDGTTCWHEQRAIATRHPDSSPLSR